MIEDQKGVQIHELLEEWKSTHDCPVSVKKLGGGNYMFDNFYVSCFIKDGELKVHVGHDYVSLDEFMNNFWKVEIK